MDDPAIPIPLILASLALKKWFLVFRMVLTHMKPAETYTELPLLQ